MFNRASFTGWFLAVLVVLTTGFGLSVTLLAADKPAGPADADAVLRYLDRSIDWYHRLIAIDAMPANSQELFYRDSTRASARTTLKLSFDFARAQAALIESRSRQPTTNSAAASTAARLKLAADAAAQRIADLKSQINQSYQNAKTAADAAMQSKLAAQLDLATAQRDALSQYAQFISSSGNGDATLSEKIDQLAQTVPEIASPAATDAGQSDSGATPAPVPQFRPEPTGIIALISDLFSLTGQMNELGRLRVQTKELQDNCDQLHGPLKALVIDEFHRANTLGATTRSSTQPDGDVARLESERQAIQSLTVDFKLTSSAGIPLGEQSIVLGSAMQSLESWHDAIARQYEADTRSLLVRAVGTALTLIALLVVSELWRRATFRYINDARRRRQLMLVRRIVIGIVFILIVIGSVVTEFGSLATFAGLITAGIAVALQTVILSGVAYFFFIGRYGVRIGDRVTVGGITGDVVEIGLFRLYLMEMAGPITDLHPTGRMIVFSNAVLFQPAAFFKQLPGADYAWHEVALTIAPETDQQVAETRLLGAVEAVLVDYRELLDRQHDAANQILHIPLEEPRPRARVRFVEKGVEIVIRYPVDLYKATEIEDRIARKLVEAIAREPKLKIVS